MVMQAAANFLAGSSNPDAANTAAAPRPASADQDRTANLKFCSRVCYHSTGGDCDTNVSPIAWSLLSENF